MKSNLITDYADYAGLWDAWKIVPCTDYADYVDIQDYVKNSLIIDHGLLYNTAGYVALRDKN